MMKNEWIKVNPENMPELLEPVIVWSGNSFHKVILAETKIATMKGDIMEEKITLLWRLIMGGTYIELNDVTHWMSIQRPIGISAEAPDATIKFHM